MMTVPSIVSRQVRLQNLRFVVVVLLLYVCDRTTDSRLTYSSVHALLLLQPSPPTTNLLRPNPVSRTNIHQNANNKMDRFHSGTIFSKSPTKYMYSKKTNNNSNNAISPLYMVNGYISLVDQFVQSSPYTTAAIACGIKASSADFIAQKRQFRKRNENNNNSNNQESLSKPTTNDASNNPVTTTTTTTTSSDAILPTTLTTRTTVKKVKTDLTRNIAFLLYGAFYQGMGQEYIYNHLYPVYFGTGTNVVTVLMKVAFDLLVQTTLLTLPVAYGIKAIIYQYSFQEAFRRYIDDIKNHGLLIKYFTLWGPVQCITFSIIPERYRISFIAIVSFFWLIILSTISSRVRSTVSSSNVTTTTTTAAAIASNVTDGMKRTTILLPSMSSSPECELVDGLTCNIDG